MQDVGVPAPRGFRRVALSQDAFPVDGNSSAVTVLNPTSSLVSRLGCVTVDGNLTVTVAHGGRPRSNAGVSQTGLRPAHPRSRTDLF